MSCSTPHRRIASNLLLRGGAFVRNPIVEVDGEGRIVSIESVESASIDHSPHTEFYSGVMLAGFINAHCHLELSYLRGQIERGCGFAQFASRIGSIRNSFSAEERASAIAQADAEMWRGGVVGVGDIINGVTSFETKAESRIAYHNFAEIFGLNTSGTEAVDELLSYGDTSITPHSTYSINDQLFKRISTASDTAPLSIHFMESPSESELFNRRGSLYEWYIAAGFECDFLHYGSPAERIIKSVPPDRSVLLVHNCTLRQQDIDLIMRHFTAPVYWVLCPCSNAFISGITPPVELLRANALNICVGTDSLASNDALSMLGELRALNNTPLVERLDWATRIGAQAIGFDDLGDIEVGKRPGINILSGVDYTNMELTDSSSIQRII